MTETRNDSLSGSLRRKLLQEEAHVEVSFGENGFIDFFVPPFLVGFIQRQDLPTVLREIKRLAENGGASKQP